MKSIINQYRDYKFNKTYIITSKLNLVKVTSLVESNITMKMNKCIELDYKMTEEMHYKTDAEFL